MSEGVATQRCPHCKPSSLNCSGMWSNRCHSLYSRWRPSRISVKEKNPTLTFLVIEGTYRDPLSRGPGPESRGGRRRDGRHRNRGEAEAGRVPLVHDLRV